ncbi:unnamed protein product [Ectocarpus fasciculatus]
MSVECAILLDVDGVLHPAEGPGQDAAGATFVTEQMRLLKEIHSSVDGGAKIVLTSNWRKYPALKRMVDKELIGCGIEEGVHDCTDVLGTGRQMEICHWLKNYGPASFVIIDDLDLTDIATYPPG